MNLKACRSLAKSPLQGTWYRAIQLQFYHSLLAIAHTGTIPGRYNAGNPAHPGFQILYLAEDPLVAHFEVQALLGSIYPGSTYIPNPNTSWAVINVQVQLARVVDLTRPSQRSLIQTSVQELTGDWRGYLLRNPQAALGPPYWSNVPTQRLGHALHAVRDLEGFVSYSARVATRRNLIVFPAKMRAGSFLRFSNPVTNSVDTIGPP